MSIGGLGPVENAVGAPLPQSKAAQIGRELTEVAAQGRTLEADKRTEQASGIGQTDARELAADERDADGRRPWEVMRPIAPDNTAPETPARPVDGESGRLLDLTG